MNTAAANNFAEVCITEQKKNMILNYLSRDQWNAVTL